MDEQRLIDKLRRVDALFSRATTTGERDAAGRAAQQLRLRIRGLAADAPGDGGEQEAVPPGDPPVEHRFSMADDWNRKLFVALLRRHGIEPYRYRRQRYTTVMARVSSGVVEKVLWPEFQELSSTLDDYLAEVTERVIREVLGTDTAEAGVVAKEAPARALPAATG